MTLSTAGFAGRGHEREGRGAGRTAAAAPKVLSNAQLGVAGFAMLAIAGAVTLGFAGGPVWPDAAGAAFTLPAAAFGILGYAALTAAIRTGEISVMTPFRYARLIFALVSASPSSASAPTR